MSEHFPPLISICSPCYNHAGFIRASLDSIRLQTYPHIEHIIIDDCSTDGSADIIEAWIAEHNYTCRFIRHTKNIGLSATFNESIELAKGTYWGALATDDLMVPERTEKFVAFMEANPSTMMVVSDCLYINSAGEEIQRNGTSSFYTYHTRQVPGFSQETFGTYESLLLANTIPSSICIRKEVFTQTGLFDPSLAMEDWDMWLRISRIAPIGYIPEALTLYRYHATNSVNNLYNMEASIAKTFISQYAYCKKNNLMAAYHKAYLQRPFFSPVRHPDLTLKFIFTGPVHKYMYLLLRGLGGKIFRMLTFTKV